VCVCVVWCLVCVWCGVVCVCVVWCVCVCGVVCVVSWSGDSVLFAKLVGVILIKIYGNFVDVLVYNKQFS
jgi:hypothetical protein